MSNKAIATPPALERCANCGSAIGKLETPHAWQDHAVCAACHHRIASPGKADSLFASRGLLRPIVLGVAAIVLIGLGSAVGFAIARNGRPGGVDRSRSAARDVDLRNDGLVIDSARYGTATKSIDVTNFVAAHLDRGVLDVPDRLDIKTGQDPDPGPPKFVFLKISVGGQKLGLTFRDADPFHMQVISPDKNRTEAGK